MGTTNQFARRRASGVRTVASTSISDHPLRPARVQESAKLVAGRLDRAGAMASIACAIHCAISPLILPLLPLMAGRLAGPAMEWAFVAVSFILGVSSLAHSYRVLHRDGRAMALFATGFAMLLLSRVFEPKGIVEPLAVFGAASLIVSAHLLNLHLRHGTLVGDWTCPCPCMSSDPTVHDTRGQRAPCAFVTMADGGHRPNAMKVS
jgi:hypothetical protein